MVRRWRQKLPTIVAPGPSSWNMGKVVWDAPGKMGPLSPEEFERAMGMRSGVSRLSQSTGEAVAIKGRCRMAGNSWAVPVVKHVLMPAMMEAGFIVRDDVRQIGVKFTMNQDGPGWHRSGSLMGGVVVRDGRRQTGVKSTTNEDFPESLGGATIIIPGRLCAGY